MTVIKTGIESLLALVTNDKSAKLASKIDLFDHLCELEGIAKQFFLYQQSRFTKLGKATVSLFQARKLLHETDTYNEFTESYQLYLETELFITEPETIVCF